MQRTLIYTGLRWFWISLVVLVLDLGSKQWVITHLCMGESVSIMPLLNFFYTLNPGSAFSFLAENSGWQRWVLSLIAILIVTVLIIIMYHSSYYARLINIAYALIIGGALGNLFDRMVHGYVIDFIDVYFTNLHWPTFNIADSSICIGAMLIVLESFFLPVNKIIR